jgi:hypothetical protein
MFASGLDRERRIFLRDHTQTRRTEGALRSVPSDSTA